MRKGVHFWGSLTLTLALSVGVGVPATASAAFPGRNGLLVVQPLRGSGLVEVKANGAVVRSVCAQRILCGTPGQPRFSPDGRSIAFVDASSSRIAVVSADGTCLWCLLGKPLTSLSGSGPAFSGNGLSLAVSRPASGVWRIPLTGGSLSEVAQGTQAAWSSTGELAIVSHGAVWVRGHGRRARLRRLGPGSEPNWSPGGEQLAVARGGSIWILSLAGGRARRLSAGTAPAWSPDGTELAYVGRGGWVRIVPVRGDRSRSLRIRGRAVDWQPLPRRPLRACSVPRGWSFVASSAQAVLASSSRPVAASVFGGWYGCQRGLGKWRLLLPGTANNAGYNTSLDAFRLAGRFALLDSTYSDKYQNCILSMNLYDLADGAQTSLGSQACGFGAGASLDSPVLDSSGFAAWRLVQPLPLSEPLNAVSCASISACVAVDNAGNVAASTNPGGGRSAWTLERTDATALGSVSCPSVSFCAATVPTGASVFTSNDRTDPRAQWTAVATDPSTSPIFPASAISCPSISLCVEADGSGNVVTSTDPSAAGSSWSSVHVLDGNPPEFSAIDCPSTSLCVAMDVHGDIVTSTKPTGDASAWSVASVDPANPLTLSGGVSCPSTTLCVGVDGTGKVLSSTNPTGGAAAWKVTPGPAGGLSAISCPGVSLCVATDDHGDVITSNNPTGPTSAWQLSKIDGTTPISGISCPSVAECVVVDSKGNVLTSNAPTAGSGGWSSAPVDIPDCAIEGTRCLVEQLRARDDQGTRTIDSTSPGNGASLAAVSLGGNNLVLRWTKDGVQQQSGLG